MEFNAQVDRLAVEKIIEKLSMSIGEKQIYGCADVGRCTQVMVCVFIWILLVTVMLIQC